MCQSLSINNVHDTRTDVGEHVLPEEAQLAVSDPADFLLEGALPVLCCCCGGGGFDGLGCLAGLCYVYIWLLWFWMGRVVCIHLCIDMNTYIAYVPGVELDDLDAPKHLVGHLHYA